MSGLITAEPMLSRQSIAFDYYFYDCEYSGNFFYYFAAWSNFVLSRYFSKYLHTFLLRPSIRLLLFVRAWNVNRFYEGSGLYGLGHFILILVI
jgi:hypothetical protein